MNEYAGKKAVVTGVPESEAGLVITHDIRGNREGAYDVEIGR